MKRFSSKSDLPQSVQDSLSDEQQDTYLDAANDCPSDLPFQEIHDTAMDAVRRRHGQAPLIYNPYDGSVLTTREESNDRLLSRAARISEDSEGHGGFLVSGKDGDHLPTEKNGKLDHGLMGAAWAALHGGYRGEKYDGPGKEEAIARLRALYQREGLEAPGEAQEGVAQSSRPSNSAVREAQRPQSLEGANSALPNFEAVDLVSEEAALGAPGPDGWVWDAEMLKPGTSLNGFHYTPEFIRAAAREFDGAPAFADHQPSAGGSVRNVVGFWQNVRADSARRGAMTGQLRILESEGWMRDKLNAMTKAGKAPGVSISMIAGMKRAKVDGREVLQPERIIPNTPRSADVVMFPSAGGRVLRAVAGSDFAAALAEAKTAYQSPGQVGQAFLPASTGRRPVPTLQAFLPASTGRRPVPTLQAFLPASTGRRPVPTSQAFLPASTGRGPVPTFPGNGAGATQREKGAKMDKNGQGAPAAETAVAVTEELRPIRDQVEQLSRGLAESQRRQRVAESVLLVNEKVAGSKLPAPLQKLVRESFEGKEATAQELDAEIRKVREAYAAVAPSGIRATGGAAAVTMEPADKMQIALDQLCGVTHSWKPARRGGLITMARGQAHQSHFPGFRGIQEAYVAYTGDRELRCDNFLKGAVVSEETQGLVMEEWASAGFANALGNTLYRRLIQDYMEQDYGMDLVCPPREPHRVALKDFRTHDIIRVGYLGNLPQVDTEEADGDWPEIAPPTDEQATLAAVQFGGLVTVTRKTIINDDLGLVAKVAARIGRAARRSLAARLWNLAINNGAIYDTGNFFNSTAVSTAGGHANLGSTALAAAELAAIRVAMRGQTEKDSGAILGIGPYILVVPINKEGTAITENERQFLDSNFTPNQVRYMFGKIGEQGPGDQAVQNNDPTKPNRIIVNPLLTDPDDYYVFADPDEIQTFELGFLQGKAEPELLLADNQLVGKAFTSDRIQYKVRHEYEVTVVDYRGAYKEVV